MTTKDGASPYEPLDSNRLQIRLMMITSAPSSDTIRCSLHTFDLNEQVPEYVALSYEWGPEEDMQTIYINNHEMKIRPNLRAFLEVIRQWDDSRPLWVDQICIDQRNISERGHQVGIMEHIYRNAVETLCWLGPDPDAGLAISAINKTCDAIEEQVNAGLDVQDIDYTFVLIVWSTDTSSLEQRAFEAMACLPYWTRLWIIQEILLSKCPTLVYGSMTVNFTRLCEMCPNGDGYSDLANDGAMGEILYMAYESYFEDDFFKRMSFGYMAKQSICLDPRDKVYGMQSLYPEELRVMVDYQKSAASVYLDMLSIWFNHFTKADRLIEFTGGSVALAKGMELSRDTMKVAWQHLQAEKHASFDTEAKVQYLDQFLQAYVYPAL